MQVIKPHYYKDTKGKWRWKITAANYRRTHSSTQGFSSKAKAKENFQWLVDLLFTKTGDVHTENGPLYE